MNKIIVVLMLFLSGCARYGSETLSLGFALDVIEGAKSNCKGGKVIYPRIQVNTNWKTREESVDYVWQCYIDDDHNEEVHFRIGTNK
jgi:hypothetical protein